MTEPIGGVRAEIRCRVCGSAQIGRRGAIYHPTPTLVAGVPIDLQGIQFELLRCAACEFQFKMPPIPEEKLLECYSHAQKDHWAEGAELQKRNFNPVKEAIARHARGRSILDIGCFNGAFLEYLGPDWKRYGVEPSSDAAEEARQRGVTILGATLDDVTPDQQFDVVLAMDVVEHIVDPLPFFQQVRRHVAPGGIFVIQTGDTDSWTWRLQGSRYWYVSWLPEHVSFFCRRAMQVLAEKCAMQSIEHNRISHDCTPVGEKLHQYLKGLVFGVGMRTGWLGMPPLRRRFRHRFGTHWIAARDHMVNVTRALSEQNER